MYLPDDSSFPEVQDHDAAHDFLSVGAATLFGAWVGHQIDQTRLGVWTNTSPTANAIFGILRILAISLAIGLAFFFVFFCLLPQF